MLSEENIFKKIRDILVEYLEIDEEQVSMKTDIYDDLGADSLDMTEIGMELEEEFAMCIDDDDARNLKTVEDFVNYIEGKLK